MARKRAERSTSSAKSESAPGVPPDGGEQQERSGPVAIERHVKDDGRALILYTHAERGRA
jgi:hypothetical protein